MKKYFNSQNLPMVLVTALIIWSWISFISVVIAYFL